MTELLLYFGVKIVARFAAEKFSRSRSAIAEKPQPQVFDFKLQSKKKLGK
jgi:hypothetical protein